jgi:dTDP-4-amino-4,6-dideoxygalactose transaminase
MYRIGKLELDALGRVIDAGKPFRYREASECAGFEKEYAQYLGVEQVNLCSSGTAALVAALVGLGIGPGDEVVVPAVTYMATATAVLVAGAIPVIVDVDESLTLDPAALRASVGPRTRAVIPVHVWGLAADLDAILEIAMENQLLVIEDVCQAVGGGRPGKMLGSFGHAGAFSFNYFKNITCGEGGAVCTRDPAVFERIRCAVDCCNFFWNGEPRGVRGFASHSSRASEFEGALLRAQLGRLPEMIATMRRHKLWVTEATADCLRAAPSRGSGLDCGSNVVVQFDSHERALDFAKGVGGDVVSQTGRHIYTRWTPVLERRGAHHPALDPYLLPENSECRKTYSLDQCARSLDIARRSVLVPMHPDNTESDIVALIGKLRALAGASEAEGRALKVG